MKTKEMNGNVSKGYTVNKELAKYSSTILFPEKLKKVTALIRNVPPPKFQK